MLGREATMPADLVFGGEELQEQSEPEYLRELHSSLLAVHKLARDQLKSTQEYQKWHYD
jgi:hypothetical protein